MRRSLLIDLIVFVTIGLLALRSRAIALGQQDNSFGWLHASTGCAKCLIVLVLVLYAFCSVCVIGTYLITPFSGTIPNWIIPTVIGSTLSLGALYYFMVFWAFASLSESGQQPVDPRSRLNILRYVGVTCEIHKADYFNTEQSKLARRFGSRRCIRYKVKHLRLSLGLANVEL